MMKSKLGHNIKVMREHLGLNQEELAERLFVSSQAVSKWEKGESSPAIETLQALANVFCTTIDNLLMGINVEECESQVSTINFKMRKIFLSNKRKDSVNAQINDVVSIIMPLYNSTNDYYWIYSGRMVLKGVIYAMLEDGSVNEENFSVDKIKEILQLSNLSREDSYNKIQNYIQNKSEKTKQLVNAYLSAPLSTGESIRAHIVTYLNLLSF